MLCWFVSYLLRLRLRQLELSQGSGCALPPPDLNCTAGQTVLCTCSGTWQCINNPGTPIIIDTTGKGFHLTSAQNGVLFDLTGDGIPEQIAWTDPNSGNALLALDRDGDGKITSGKELFGNYTQQPSSPNPNGFLALAEFDKPANGGNGDGVIDSRDAVYSKLLLWIDVNHDGISQPNELHTLPELGIYSISLDYKTVNGEDQFGNIFRYGAPVNEGIKSPAGHWAFDVFLAGTQEVSGNGHTFKRMGTSEALLLRDPPFWRTAKGCVQVRKERTPR